MKILVSFSGGKDSQACLIQAFKQYGGGGNLTAVFCDTGWEHPDTYKHVNDVCLQMGVRLITLKSKYDFVSLAAHKKRFPSTNARCQKPVKLYAEILRKNAKEGDKIFDSHLGSGSSRIAAYGLGFDFYATEIDEEYFEAQEERFHRECFGEIKTERGTLVQTNLFDRE